jgi:DNA-binding GntR family transcriptional regulator
MTASKETKKDQIAQHLRELIASGELARGERVHQDELAARFDVSTTPVREALRELQAEGLLTGEPHRGVRVASVDLEELQSVYIMRRLLEPYALQRASMHVSRADLAHVREIVATMAAAVEAGDDDTVRRTNREFHFFLYGRSGVPGLLRAIQQLWVSFPWDVLQVLEDRARASVHEHEGILEALSNGSIAEVREALEEHLRLSYLAIAAHLGETDSGCDPFVIDGVDADRVTT